MRKAYIDSQEEYRVTPANMPRWDLAGEVRKNRRSGDNFPATTLLHALLCYDFSFLLLILMKIIVSLICQCNK